MNAAACATTSQKKTNGPAAWVYMFAFSVGAVMAVFIACQLEGGIVPFAGCGFKHLIGLPCPGCGATRSLAALAQFDLLRSFLLNPLVSVVAMAAPLAVPGAWFDARFNRGRTANNVARFCRSRGFTQALVGLVVVNWSYLLLMGR